MAGDRLLAFDLGAESGRAVVGTLADGRIALAEVHRFANRPVRMLNSLYWDVGLLWEELKAGLKKAAREGGAVRSLGVDTWGVDFGLLAADGSLLGQPFHYRDERTANVLDRVFRRVPRPELFRATGLQFLPFNTLFQLFTMAEAGAPALAAADKLLWMADLFHYWFTGRAVAEYTLASTGQMLDPHTQCWAEPLLGRLGIPLRFLPEIVPPGTVLGGLHGSVLAEMQGLGLERAVVVAPAEHDTGAAVAAVPGVGERWAYISSGTWSLMGVELTAPRVDDCALRYNFTNEGGIEGTVRFLKNIAGLWLVQECRRAWAEAGTEYDYVRLTELASAAPPFRSLVDPDAPEFLTPGKMPEKISALCRRTDQPEPGGAGEFVRCALESLALRYRQTLEELEEATGRSVERIHVVGGGSRNSLLCQFSADATGREVVAGPVEATALGNIVVQATALGLMRDREEGREWIARSFPLIAYRPDPGQAGTWEAAYRRFRGLAASRAV